MLTAPDDHTDPLKHTHTECSREGNFIMYDMYVWQASQKRTHKKHTRSHRYEEDAAQQGASESSFDDLCIALVSCAVTLQQSCDVEGHLRNRAERGVYYRSHCKVTLGGNTTEKTMVFTLI